jgi:hypothetical protein
MKRLALLLVLAGCARPTPPPFVAGIGPAGKLPGATARPLVVYRGPMTDAIAWGLDDSGMTSNPIHWVVPRQHILHVDEKGRVECAPARVR